MDGRALRIYENKCIMNAGLKKGTELENFRVPSLCPAQVMTSRNRLSEEEPQM